MNEDEALAPENGNQMYVYAPLDKSKKEIRLVELLPNPETKAPIFCKLKTISLEDISKTHLYEALSYAWGDPQDVEYINVNGKQKTVTSNLGSALRQLRNPYRMRELWIDAVCIDQDNVEERGDQIQFMKQIYSSATATRVWLGPADFESDRVYTLIKKLVTGSGLLEQRLEGEYFGRSDVTAFKEVFARAWWRRVWILQEVVVAKQVLLQCGGRQMHMRDLFSAIEILKSVPANTRDRRRARYDPAAVPELLAMIEGSLALISHLMHFHKINSAIHPPPASLWKHFLDKNTFADFVQLLSRCRSSLATDSRDKIYSLVGLAPDSVRAQIMPAYHLSVAEVYTRAALRLTRQLDSLLIFSQVAAVAASSQAFRQDGASALPSWVPDWTTVPEQRPKYLELRFRLDNLFSACGGRRLKMLFLDNDHPLRLHGVRLGSLSKLGPIMPSWASEEDISTCLEGWDLFLDQEVERIHRDTSGISSISSLTIQDTQQWLTGSSEVEDDESIQFAGIFEPYWRTIINDTVPESGTTNDTTLRRARADDEGTFYKWRQKRRKGGWADFAIKRYGDEVSSDEDHFHIHIMACTEGRRLFRCMNGQIGLGPSGTRVGDVLVVLAGGRFPCVLRPLRDKLHHYTLVGESFVHGIMDGEAARSSSRTWTDIFLT